MKLILKFVGSLFVFIEKSYNKIYSYCCRELFLDCGQNVSISKNSFFSFKNISIGNDVFIGKGAYFSTILQNGIVIGDKVMFGPYVSIIGGDHNTSELGKYMFDATDKNMNDDLPIIIQRDVWVGANVTILKGVTIGEGSIIAAGALVNKNVPPYSILAGVPGKVLRKRFSDSDLSVHIKKLKQL